MFKIDKNKLRTEVKKLVGKRVLVIGDLVLDEMVYGEVERPSREAPVLILQHSHTKLILGGGSNAAHNVATLNKGKISVIGVCGDDYQSELLLKTFEEANVNTEYMVKDSSRPTTTKTRISACAAQSVTQQIVRMDRQTYRSVSGDIEKQIIENIRKAVPEHDAIILSDYHISLMTDNIIQAAIDCANEHKKLICVDVQKNFERYKNITILTPNQPDAERFVGYKITDEAKLKQAASDIFKATNSKYVLITRGGDGMSLFDENLRQFSIPAFNKTDVFDVTGAGDSVIASLTLALAAGIEPEYSVIISNLAASIVIRTFGCATTTVEELDEQIDNFIEG